MGNFLANYLYDFIARFDGPLHLRLFMQPLMATFLAVRHGIRDAQKGRAAYGWAVLTDQDHRRYLLENGWKDIGKVLILAYVLDVVYQFLVWHGLKPLQATLTACILAVAPYLLLRGPVNRLIQFVRVRGKRAGA